MNCFCRLRVATLNNPKDFFDTLGRAVRRALLLWTKDNGADGTDGARDAVESDDQGLAASGFRETTVTSGGLKTRGSQSGFLARPRLMISVVFSKS